MMRRMPSAAQKAKRKKARRMSDAPRIRGPRITPDQIDYKDIATLQRLVSTQGKLFSRKRTGLDAAGQRKLALAIKRARYMALLPYVT